MIGIDIIEIDRFESVASDNFSSWDKVFTKVEWDYCFMKPKAEQHLAGIFAAKEAVMKAVGGSIMKNYSAIEITHGEDGKPLVSVGGLEEKSVSISISHNETTAVAVVIVPSDFTE